MFLLLYICYNSVGQNKVEVFAALWRNSAKLLVRQEQHSEHLLQSLCDSIGTFRDNPLLLLPCSSPLPPSSNLRVEPTLSTTQPDTATWTPWSSSTRRCVLWTSKIRWRTNFSFFHVVQPHTGTPAHLSTSQRATHTLFWPNAACGGVWFSPKTLWYTERFTLSRRRTWAEHQQSFPLLLAHLVACCYRNRFLPLRKMGCCRRCLPRPHGDCIFICFLWKIKPERNYYSYLLNQKCAAGFSPVNDESYETPSYETHLLGSPLGWQSSLCEMNIKVATSFTI